MQTTQDTLLDHLVLVAEGLVFLSLTGLTIRERVLEGYHTQDNAQTAD